MTHIPHDDTHTHGFCDECPRCAEYPKDLRGIDYENLRRIWSGDIKTNTDMKVYNALYRAAVEMQHLCSAFQYADHSIQDVMAGEPSPPAFPFDQLFTVGGRS